MANVLVWLMIQSNLSSRLGVYVSGGKPTADHPSDVSKATFIASFGYGRTKTTPSISNLLRECNMHVSTGM